MTISVSASNIYKSYGKDDILKGLSLDLYQGEILALLGPNGSGKTTFIKILATLLTKDSGTVRILGHDIDTDANEIRHLFGYVGQDTERSAYGRLTVVENLHFFGALRGLNKKRSTPRSRSWCSTLTSRPTSTSTLACSRAARSKPW